jgi:hypothetical protein
MDLPKTLNNLIWTIFDIFVDENEISTLKSNPKFPIDFIEKNHYERILEYSELIKNFKKIRIKDIKKEFLSEFTEINSEMKR